MFLKLRVHPGAREERLHRRAPDAYEVWVRAPAEAGRANAAALRLLGQALRVEAKRLRIVKGGHSPSKIVELR